ncbi:MAG: flagellar basal body P-ring formation chaperone FlgA [Alphaproteobacteria bacterium]
MTMRAILAFAALALAAAGAEALAAEPRSQVEVTGAIVTVGDLFIDAGDAAGEAVFYAPEPGRAVEIGPNFLHRVALGFDLDWAPGNGLDRIIVRRAAQAVGLDVLEPVLLSALATRVGPQFNPDHTQIAFDSGIATRYLPVDVTLELNARDVAYDPRSQRFSAIVDIAPGTAYATSLRASGRLRSVVLAPVLVRPLARNDVIGAADVQWMEVDADRMPSNVLLDAERLVGQTARRALSPNQPITEADVTPPVAVRRGEIVTMVLETGSLTLTAQARALEDGVVGEAIRVVNTQSSRTVDATVEAPGVVRVQAPSAATVIQASNG